MGGAGFRWSEPTDLPPVTTLSLGIDRRQVISENTDVISCLSAAVTPLTGRTPQPLTSRRTLPEQDSENSEVDVELCDGGVKVESE